MLASDPASILNHKSSKTGIPFDSVKQRTALEIPPALPLPSDLTAAVMRWEAAHNVMIEAWGAVPVKERAGLLQPNLI
jgi:hypothetical protein